MTINVMAFLFLISGIILIVAEVLKYQKESPVGAIFWKCRVQPCVYARKNIYARRIMFTKLKKPN